MSERLLFYNPLVALPADKEDRFPGLKSFSRFFAFYHNSNTAICDRSGTLRIPVRMKSLFPLPTMRVIKKSLEEICNERALELLKRADTLDAPIHLMWSGGIDSTLALVSLLKNATPVQRERIVVLLTEDSILENKNFYADHIRGTLKVDSANILDSIIGTRVIIVGGEGNDQIFGAGSVYRKLIPKFGAPILHEPYSRNLYFELFKQTVPDEARVNFYLDICERICAAAPIPILTNAEFAWWEKFVLKWQSVYMRKLISVSPRNAHLLTAQWADDMYQQFYMTDEFQLWSMNNPDKRIKDSWKSYKWPCKDIIYDFTKDADYRDNKTKTGSLRTVFQMRRLYNFIDESFHPQYDMSPEIYYEPENDFRS